MNPHHTLYDKILTELSKDGFHDHNPERYHSVDLQYLSSKGFVDLQYVEGGRIFSFGITDAGVEFISEGGFTEQDRKEYVAERDAEMQRINWETTTKGAKHATIISWLSLVVSIIAAILALIAMI